MPPDRRSGRCGPGAGADEPPKLGIFSARFAIGRPDADSHFRDTTMDIPTLAARDVRRALEEDLGTGDLTAALIDPQAMARATVRTREAARLCGAPWAQACLHALDPAARMDWKATEGAELPADFVFLELRANARALLSAERTMLNFLQLLSAVATQTAQYVEAVRGTRAQIVDTRKTLPGLRLAQKYAVRVGGGMNHRIGLFDAVLIKENHIAAAGGIAPALERARRVAAQAQFIEIEVETLEQLDEALRADAPHDPARQHAAGAAARGGGADRGPRRAGGLRRGRSRQRACHCRNRGRPHLRRATDQGCPGRRPVAAFRGRVNCV